MVMNKKKIGGILLFLGAVGIIGATSILNEQKSSAVDRDRETARAARKNSIKASSKISELTEQVKALSSQLSSVNAASLSATSGNASDEMSASEAEKIALNYYLSLNRKDNGYKPRVDSSKTIEKNDYFAVAVSDTSTHIIEIDVNKKTHQVTSAYLQDTSSSSTKGGDSSSQTSTSESGEMNITNKAQDIVNKEYTDYKYSKIYQTKLGAYYVTFERKDDPESIGTIEFDSDGNEVNRTGFTE